MTEKRYDKFERYEERKTPEKLKHYKCTDEKCGHRFSSPFSKDKCPKCGKDVIVTGYG